MLGLPQPKKAAEALRLLRLRKEEQVGAVEGRIWTLLPILQVYGPGARASSGGFYLQIRSLPPAPLATRWPVLGLQCPLGSAGLTARLGRRKDPRLWVLTAEDTCSGFPRGLGHRFAFALGLPGGLRLQPVAGALCSHRTPWKRNRRPGVLFMLHKKQRVGILEGERALGRKSDRERQEPNQTH